MDDKLKNYAIGALTLTLLISAGFIVSPNDNYLCRDLEITKYCNRLSGPEKTCYPTPATRIGSKFCSTAWEELMIVTELDLKPGSGSSNIGLTFECSPAGCKQIR